MYYLLYCLHLSPLHPALCVVSTFVNCFQINLLIVKINKNLTMVRSRLPLSADKDCSVFIKIFLTNASHYLRYTSVPFIRFYLS